MDVELLRKIRKVEQLCEEKIKNALLEKERIIGEAEKQAVFKLREAEVEANNEANEILKAVEEKIKLEKERLEKEYLKEKEILEQKYKKKEKDVLEDIIEYIMS